MANNDLGQAAPHYRQATKLDPTTSQASLNLGRVLAATGRGEPARAALQRTLRLRSTDARTQAALQQLAN
jgi:thioredoxin-like negative regulator of GroEL